MFAAFGGFSTAVLASFRGSRQDKAIRHLSLAVMGSLLLSVGTFARLAPNEFAYSAMDETLTAAAEAYLLWGDTTGFEHPDHETNRRMCREDLRPETHCP
jgi:hypothetical protein